MVDSTEDSDVTVSFKAPPKLVEILDKMAADEQRTRSNLILRLLSNLVLKRSK